MNSFILPLTNVFTEMGESNSTFYQHDNTLLSKRVNIMRKKVGEAKNSEQVIQEAL